MRLNMEKLKKRMCTSEHPFGTVKRHLTGYYFLYHLNQIFTTVFFHRFDSFWKFCILNRIIYQSYTFYKNILRCLIYLSVTY